MRLSDFRYDLPAELIAQHPLAQRSASRLLCVEQEALSDRRFADLPELLRAGDLLVFNDTRVIPARMYGRKETGGRVEILIERLLSERRALAHVRASKSPRAGTFIDVGDQRLRVLGRQGALFEIEAEESGFETLMEREGHIPLPPYIEREDADEDRSRYQTVYAARPGAVAAPTAGLHFDESLLARLGEQGVEFGYVTLHVGAGTFQPVREDDLDRHVMHSEYLEVDERLCNQVRETRMKGGRVIAVGTTSVRSLETASATGEIQPYKGETRLFIRPGYRFRSVDALITNFHLPESTLLMLVAAFAGYDRIMAAYRHAVEARYRFFSYGDAMWLTPSP